VQYIAVTILRRSRRAVENNMVHGTGEFVLSLIWLVVVLSIGSIGLLYWLIRRRRDRGASLFYLVPAVSCHWPMAVRRTARSNSDSGMVACAAAVFLVNRRALT